MFSAFSISEKIHADNYKRIINGFGGTIEINSVSIDVRDTRSNLNKAFAGKASKWSQRKLKEIILFFLL